VDGNTFSIRKRLKVGPGNSFQTWLSGRIVPEIHGTRFECRIGMSRIVFAVLPVLLIAAWFGNRTPSTSMSPFFVTVLLAVFFFLGRYAARNERQFLLAFMQYTVAARELGNDSAATIEADVGPR
jgi:hypothetical protein